MDVRVDEFVGRSVKGGKINGSVDQFVDRWM